MQTNEKEPWQVPGVPWKSESAFWQWVRGVLRKGWSKHPVKLEYIKQHRKRIANPKPSKRFPEVWGMTCAKCGKDHVQTNIEIDHISDEAGKFTCLDDVKAYVSHLFLIDFESIRAVCKDCHKAISYAQKEGISFEEALLQKRVIEICKDKQKVLDFCQSHGYDTSTLTNAKTRREAVEAILRRGK